MAKIKLYRFGPDHTDGDASMKDVLGGKAAGLSEMSKLGIKVPPGFTIPCDVSVTYQKLALKQELLDELFAEVDSHLHGLSKHFGYAPLLSVRSGARVSMPGMMDTILNVGLTSKTLPQWQERIGGRAALDSYRRLIQMYGSVALGIDMKLFEEELHAARTKAGVAVDSDLSESDLSRLVTRYLAVVKQATDNDFPDSVEEQVHGAIVAVFESWRNPRAEEYRKLNGIPFEWGTSATVQSMVFGNRDAQSCTGVLFTRDPSTGENKLTGEWLENAQGEDVVAGIRTPHDIETMASSKDFKHVLKQLGSISDKLEKHYKDMQDIEFTVQSGELYLLQTRNAKRSALAAFKVAHDMVEEGLITAKEAVSRVTRSQLLAAMSDTIDPSFKTPPDLVGIAAGGGVVTGVAMFNAVDAANCTEPCILVTKETDPDDIAGMAKAVGILTATGGLTSHAAVVARGMNKACVVGAVDLSVGPAQAVVQIPGGKSFHKGQKITIDGATGRVWFTPDVPVISGGGMPEIHRLIAQSVAATSAAQRADLHGAMGVEQIREAILAVKSPAIHIDVAALEYGAMSAVNVVGAMAEVGAALDAASHSRVYLDLTPLEAYYTEWDAMFGKIVGQAIMQHAQPHPWLVEGVQNWSKALLERTYITGAAPTSTVAKMLVEKGCKIAGAQVKTFADLALASGSVSVTQEVIDNVFGGQAGYQKALEMIEKTSGKKLSPMVPPVYWYEAFA